MRRDPGSLLACADEWEKGMSGHAFLLSSRRLRGGGFSHSCEYTYRKSKTDNLPSARKLTHRQVEALQGVAKSLRGRNIAGAL
jgi:hypothetical protein